MSTNTFADAQAAHDARPFELGMKVRLWSGADVGVVRDIVPSMGGTQIVVDWPKGPAIHDVAELLRMAMKCGYCERPISEGAYCDRRCLRLDRSSDEATEVYA